MTQPTAIVLAAFGASLSAVRLTYRSIEASVRAEYPQNEIAWAYLSRRIIASQRKLGVYLPTLSETLSDLHSRGFRSVVVQPLLVAPGEEYRNMKDVAQPGLNLYFGNALLEGEAGVEETLDAIAHHVQPDVPNVLVCHGNRKHREFNLALLELQEAARRRSLNLVVASIEGEPGHAPLDRARAMAQLHGGVVFIPFMMVAGEHITKDVMGETRNSWRNLVGVPRCECRPPLGENLAVHRLFLRRIDAALKLVQENPAYV